MTGNHLGSVPALLLISPFTSPGTILQVCGLNCHFYAKGSQRQPLPSPLILLLFLCFHASNEWDVVTPSTLCSHPRSAILRRQSHICTSNCSAGHETLACTCRWGDPRSHPGPCWGRSDLTALLANACVKLQNHFGPFLSFLYFQALSSFPYVKLFLAVQHAIPVAYLLYWTYYSSSSPLKSILGYTVRLVPGKSAQHVIFLPYPDGAVNRIYKGRFVRMWLHILIIAVWSPYHLRAGKKKKIDLDTWR